MSAHRDMPHVSHGGAEATTAGVLPAPAPGAASWTRAAAARRRRRRAWAASAIVIGGLSGILTLVWVMRTQAGGVGALLIPALLALIPLGIVLAAVRWIDRWEPEPLPVLATAFVWGCGVASAISLLVNTTTASHHTADMSGGTLLLALVYAPLVEETTKGMGVLLIFLLWRRSFNGTVDGIVYAAVIAGGFAFAENIVYFVQFRDELLTTFVMRALASPFAHVTFTACTGVMLGMSTRMRRSYAWVWMAPCGVAGAVALHAMWNGILIAAPQLYLIVEIPFFLACVALVMWLRVNERMMIRRRLSDYARAGWLEDAEILMMTTRAGRQAALHWARRQDATTHAAMSDFFAACAQLAHVRQQAVDGCAGADYASRERALLVRITRAKKELYRS